MDLRKALKVMADGEELRQVWPEYENRCRINMDKGHFELKRVDCVWSFASSLSPHATYERVEPEVEDDVPPGFDTWPIEWDRRQPVVAYGPDGYVTLDRIIAERGFAGWGYRHPVSGVRKLSGIRPLYYNPTLGCLQSDWQKGSEVVQPDCVLMQKETGHE